MKCWCNVCDSISFPENINCSGGFTRFVAHDGVVKQDREGGLKVSGSIWMGPILVREGGLKVGRNAFQLFTSSAEREKNTAAHVQLSKNGINPLTHLQFEPVLELCFLVFFAFPKFLKNKQRLFELQNASAQNKTKRQMKFEVRLVHFLCV